MSDELRFDGRVAVVTGAGGGLGREHALLLGARGARVVVNDIGGVDPEAQRGASAEATVEAIRATGGEAIADTNSVVTSEGGRAIVETALSEYGRVDVVVHNAGVGRVAPHFEDLTDEQLDQIGIYPSRHQASYVFLQRKIRFNKTLQTGLLFGQIALHVPPARQALLTGKRMIGKIGHNERQQSGRPL